MPERSTWAEWWGMSCGAAVLDGILWKIVGDLWLLSNFVVAPLLVVKPANSFLLRAVSCSIHDVQKYPLEFRFSWNVPNGKGLKYYTSLERHLFSITNWVKFSFWKPPIDWIFSSEVVKALLSSFLHSGKWRVQLISDCYLIDMNFKSD